MHKNIIIFALMCFFSLISRAENPTIVTAEGNVTNKGSRTGRVILDTKQDVTFNSVTLGGEQRTTWPTGGGGNTGIYYAATLNFTNLGVIGATQDAIMSTPGSITNVSPIAPIWPATIPTDSGWEAFVPSNDFTCIRRTARMVCNGYTNRFDVIINGTNSFVGLNPLNLTMTGHGNAGGNRWTNQAPGIASNDGAVISQVETWTNISIPFNSISNALATNTFVLFSLPAHSYISKAVVNGNFVVTNAQDLIVRVGHGANPSLFTGGMSVSVTNGAPIYAFNIFDVPSRTTTTNIIATFQTTTTNGAYKALIPTNGTVNIWLQKGVLP